MCAKLMRQILTDFARSRLSGRRGAEAQHLSLDEALDRLAAVDPRKSQVVELRFFGGLSVEETADVLKVSTETVKRDWRLAKSWLVRELTPGPTNESTDFTDCTEKKRKNVCHHRHRHGGPSPTRLRLTVHAFRLLRPGHCVIGVICGID